MNTYLVLKSATSHSVSLQNKQSFLPSSLFHNINLSTNIILNFVFFLPLSCHRTIFAIFFRKITIKFFNFMGLIRFELMTPSLSEKCSNHLSYSPEQKYK